MLSITRLKEFLAEAKDLIDTINYINMVVDDSQLLKLLKDRETDDNNFLIGIVPQFGVNGDEDRAKWNNQLMFMVLAKTSRSDIDLEEQVQVLENTRLTAQALVNYMLESKVGENGDLCGLMNELEENSIVVTPIWEKAQCCGWMIQIDLLTRV
jgi:hypothetical protein